MRYLILSDLHANIEALRAVLEAVDLAGIDKVLVLGDLVGYGASPNETVEAVRSLSQPVAIVRGNHDKAAVGLDDGSRFNEVARIAAAWTGDRLTDDNRSYIEQLPRGPQDVDGRLLICHGSPRDEDEYLLSADAAGQVFDVLSVTVTFFGHSHLPGYFLRRSKVLESCWVNTAGLQLDIESPARYLINPGSVGQPRDGDPRAAFMTYDGEVGRATWERVSYAVSAAQQKILDAGLPAPLAQRLARGT